MKLTIDNFDSLGTVDYTAAVDAAGPFRIRRRLNRPSELSVSLFLSYNDLLVPSQGARVIVRRRDGQPLFTGYLRQPPEYEYLGWAGHGPLYRYHLVATGDEILLDRKRLRQPLVFTARSAGSTLKRLTDALTPGALDMTQVQDASTLPSFTATATDPWSGQAAAIALLARACYRVLDAKLAFAPVGTVRHELSEESPGFSPSSLQLHQPDTLVNDITIAGRSEPAAYVKDYFIGDGLTLVFPLSNSPFTRYNQTLLEDEFTGATLDPLYWSAVDPANTIATAGGSLACSGGSGMDGATTIALLEQLELGGALAIDHGDLTFTAPSDAVIGGLYLGAVAIANCLAGFRITPSGQQSAIRALVNSIPTGPAITTVAGHIYGLRTRLYASTAFRTGQLFHSSVHSAGSGLGGSPVAADVRVVLEVHDVDPASPGSVGAVSTVLYDNVLASAPGYCCYALVNALNLHCAIRYMRLRRMVDAEIRSAVAGGSFRTRLLAGNIAEGAECTISSTANLKLYPQYVPVANERIVVRYRSSAAAIARITDAASAPASGSDDGVRAATVQFATPAARISADCENAALALLDDATQPGWAGEYEAWSDFFPAGAADVFPGDAIAVQAPSRGAQFDAIIREVELELLDLGHDRRHYKIHFANDAAEPLAYALQTASITRTPAVTTTVGASTSPFLADLPAAEVTEVTSTTVTVDAGTAPPAGGGIEVRRSDTAWGEGNDRNLIGRFTARTFTATRLTRIQDLYLRQYDNATPRRYSRYSTLLHVDYPY